MVRDIGEALEHNPKAEGKIYQPPCNYKCNDWSGKKQSCFYAQVSVDSCVAHVSQQLRSVEEQHDMALWRAAESEKAVTPEIVLRSMVKFAYFDVREIAPTNAPEHGLSLLKLANKWTRTNELVRLFNTAVAACKTPTLRPIYFPQYKSKVLPLSQESLGDLLLQLQKILSVMIPPLHR